jgi:uncharacterized Rmd1/YagE family protein
MASLYTAGSVVSVRALLLGERIDLKGLQATERLATNPLLIQAGDGQYAALFRYGAVVLFGVNPLQEVTFVDQLMRLVGQPHAKRESEETRLRVDAAGEERVEGGEVVVRDATAERLQVIADALAKSVVLEDEYELAERRLALERKLELTSRTVETLVDLLQNERALRVEWYIVLLIVLEIMLTLYQLFFLGAH